MTTEKQKYYSLAAIVVAAVLFGMVIAGGLDLTPPAGADRSIEPPPAVQATAATDFAALADRVVPPVVSVFVKDVQDPSERNRRMPRDPFHDFWRFGPERPDDEPSVRRSSGSGFFISADGEILTNDHVIDDADDIVVELDDGTRYDVTVVGRDPATDLALLRVDEPDRDFAYLALGDSEAVRVGEWVMAVGNPLEMDHTVTVGVVSAKGRVLGLSSEGSSFENYIQTDAAINLGNSGGPLVNVRGEVIGINTAINARGQNLGFAVPVNTARRIVPQLRETGKVVRGYLGISIENLDQDMAEAFGLKSRDGALVVEVVPGRAADKGGLRHGDVVVAVDGEKISDTRELIDTVSAMPPGTEIKVTVIRDGNRKDIEVELEERDAVGEAGGSEAEPSRESDTAERVGIDILDLSAQSRRMYGVEDDVEGVVVTRVRPVSPAADQGLVRGDVIVEANGEPVASADELQAVVDQVASGGYLRLYVFRPQFDRSFFAILKLDE
ncbi:MAG TPA: Do family serine endopeptidase [Candidatus Sulfomarinibacteraceae bacterium]|nr:Do family serine endopeptidase [Candidatus Sulfomarinibacteraceae bacterium]